MHDNMKGSTTYLMPRVVLGVFAVALFVVQWLVGEFPVWLFEMPMNLLVGLLWLVLLWESYRHREKSSLIRYMLSAEATYVALAVSAIIAAVLGLQAEPSTTSWPVVGGGVFVLSVLTLVILRGWRNDKGVRWRFLTMHCGLWLALLSMLLGAADKQVLRVEVGETPLREAINERGVKSYLDYELRLDKFEIEKSQDGTPKQFKASVAIDEKVVDIEVNSPYSQSYGEDIYLVSYAADGCVLQIVREPWRVVTTFAIALLLLGALMLFMQGIGGRR